MVLHSSGNYLITGYKGDSITVLLLSPDGDSLWSRSSLPQLPGRGIKSIEVSTNKIATLGYSGGFGIPTQYVLIFDSISPLTGIEDYFAAENVEVFPNPANDKLFIRIIKQLPEPCMFELYNAAGSLMHELSFSKSFEVPLSEYPPGVYFYMLRNTERTMLSGKILIIRQD